MGKNSWKSRSANGLVAQGGGIMKPNNERCEALPIAKYGKDYGVYLGCKWCEVKEECQKETEENQKKKVVFKRRVK